MIYDNTDEVIEELFEPLLNRYHIGLETPIHLLHYKCHKIQIEVDHI